MIVVSIVVVVVAVADTGKQCHIKPAVVSRVARMVYMFGQRFDIYVTVAVAVVVVPFDSYIRCTAE